MTQTVRHAITRVRVQTNKFDRRARRNAQPGRERIPTLIRYQTRVGGAATIVRSR